MNADIKLYTQLLAAMWRTYHKEIWAGHTSDYYNGKNTINCSVCTKNVDVAFAVFTSNDSNQ